MKRVANYRQRDKQGFCSFHLAISIDVFNSLQNKQKCNKMHILTHCCAAYALFIDVCWHGLGYCHWKGHGGCENKPVWSAWGETDWCGTFSTQTHRGVWFRFLAKQTLCLRHFRIYFWCLDGIENKSPDLKQCIWIPGTIKSENYLLSSIHQLVEFSGRASSCQFSLCVFNSQRGFELLISFHCPQPSVSS